MERLIQEDYVTDPWKMLVCCILLNQTSNQQVRKVLDDVFNVIPSPEKASEEKTVPVVEGAIKSTGFSKIKSQRIFQMSRKWIQGFNSVTELPGIGRYGSDSWEIFVKGNLSLEVTDKKLKLYLEAFNQRN